MRTLYFEGAGMDFYEQTDKDHSDVGNHRIRTAFKVEGLEAPVYLELSHSRVAPKDKRKHTEGYEPGDLVAFVDHCLLIGVPHPVYQTGQFKNLPCERKVHFPYTLNGILQFVNEYIGGNFTNIEIVDQYEAYHVFGDNNTYKLMDDFTPNPRRAKARREAYNRFFDTAKLLFPGLKYPNFGIKGYNEDEMTFKYHCNDDELRKAGLQGEYTYDISIGMTKGE